LPHVFCKQDTQVAVGKWAFQHSFHISVLKFAGICRKLDIPFTTIRSTYLIWWSIIWWDSQNCYTYNSYRNTNMWEAVTHNQCLSSTLYYLVTGNNFEDL